jgi:DNA-directed RNA polymerase
VSDSTISPALLFLFDCSLQFLPMVVPPVPWQRRNLGGHLTLRTSVMRVRGSAAQRQRLEEADTRMIEGTSNGCLPVYESLNALGETAWSINPDVYKVVEAIWAWGGGMCDIPARADVPEPAVLKPGFRIRRAEPSGPMLVFGVPKADVNASYYNAQRAKKKNNELHSLRCDMEYKLAIAREFSHEERFYFPHNVDFRGRAYPMHPHLNHLGSDMCRGLLQFAEERPLGPNGLRWLYIQAANLWGKGIDKLSLDGRVRWVEEHIGSIIDNASDPFAYEGKGDSRGRGSNADTGQPLASLQDSSSMVASRAPAAAWYEAEAPFQFLATCYDIYRALSSGDPAGYRSRLPVHQDGSCNGLQHYAALGRDLSGGWAVNLCPVDRPQDVYSEISRLVAKRVEADAAAGVPEAQTLLKSTEIDRKLVKQTVMTSVYGVTFVGARAQIGNRLKERGFEDSHVLYKVSCYSARVTLDCLLEMFSSAKHIMQWLSECARLIAKEGRVVSWTTPLGLPVVQPYRRKTQQHVRTVLQRLVLATEHDTKPVMKQRQRTAFPPNFIHSIDSSHMMMTAVECRKLGLDFAGVHDSFWTHAGTVDQMNEVLRETFVALHSQPLLENLLAELEHEHPTVVFPPLPPRGDLDLEDIKSATYFFS